MKMEIFFKKTGLGVFENKLHNFFIILKLKDLKIILQTLLTHKPFMIIGWQRAEKFCGAKKHNFSFSNFFQHNEKLVCKGEHYYAKA